MTWPAVSLAHARAVLTAPGAPFEMEEVVIRGVPTRTWKHLPPTLPALLESSRQHGERCFVAYQDERISYKGHYRAVATLAHWLLASSVGKGDRIGLAMRNLPEWPVIFFAALSVGAIIVPLNAWWRGPELATALADCDATVLFCDPERLERLTSCSADLTALRLRIVVRGGLGEPCIESIIGHSSGYGSLPDHTLPALPLSPENDATIFYTSGTTSGPKGVLATHRAVLSNIGSSAYAAARNAVRRGQVLPPASPKTRLLTVPLFHVTGCVASLVTGMMGGNTNILMHHWDAGEALAIIEREHVNIAGGVPTIAWQLLDHPDRAMYDLSSLEALAYGGAPSAPELARRVHAELGAMPGNGWGMTETTGTLIAHSAQEYLARPQSCGLPVAVADLRITDAAGRMVPVGGVGELWAKGPMVATGYWRRPDATAAAFVDGWVCTGDIARLDADGFCTIVDRAKDVVIRGGENIYSSEVEDVLYAHPAIAEAALVGVPHRTLGEEPAAVIKLRAGTAVDEAALRIWVSDRLAAFKVPVRFLFINGSLPRNASGKVLKSDLRALLTVPDKEITR